MVGGFFLRGLDDGWELVRVLVSGVTGEVFVQVGLEGIVFA